MIEMMIKQLFFFLYFTLSIDMNIYNYSQLQMIGNKSFKKVQCYNLPIKTNLQSILAKILDQNALDIYEEIPYYTFTHRQNYLFIYYQYNKINHMIIQNGLDVFKYNQKNKKKITLLHRYDINDTEEIDINLNDSSKYNIPINNTLKYVKNTLYDNENLFDISQLKITKIKNSNIVIQAVWIIDGEKQILKIDPHTNEAFFKNINITFNDFALYPVDIKNINISKSNNNKIVLKRKSPIYAVFNGLIIKNKNNKIILIDNKQTCIAIISNLQLNTKLLPGMIIEKGDLIGYGENYIFYEKNTL